MIPASRSLLRGANRIGVRPGTPRGSCCSPVFLVALIGLTAFTRVWAQPPAAGMAGPTAARWPLPAALPHEQGLLPHFWPTGSSHPLVVSGPLHTWRDQRLFQSVSSPRLQLELGRSQQAQRLLLVSAGMVMLNWVVYHQLNDAWWQEARSRFHFYRGYHRSRGSYDLAPSDSYYYHLDKAGHFYSASLLTTGLLPLYRWVGYSEPGAARMAVAVASLLMLEIELYDGFFRDWGFSLGDFVANELGVASVLLQRRHPAWRGVACKLSYDPQAPLEDDHWLKNYGAMTFWLSVPVRSRLPRAMQRLWPRWLNLAAGYGTDRLRHGRAEAYLSFDLNPDELLRSRSPHLWPLRALLRHVHLPWPALQVRPFWRGHMFLF